MGDSSPASARSRVQDLGDGIWSVDTVFNRPLFDASHLIVENGHAAFVDVATGHCVPDLLAALEGRGLTPADVDHVILTHVHLDHAGGAGELMRHLPNATLVVHPRGARHMVDPSALLKGAAAVYGEDEVRRAHGEVLPVDRERVVEAPEGFVLELGGRPLLFWDTPGHARHHVCIWDERSRSFFTGDTFGLAYPQLTTERGPFIMPSTTPVQFDPEALKASVDRMVERQPRAMLLTHYSIVADVPRLADELLAQVRALVDLARDADGRPARGTHLRTAVGEYFLGRAADHGCTQTSEEIRHLLALDIDLNSQGLEVWLDKRKL